MRLCQHGENPTLECMNKHVLEFVDDPKYNAPKDPSNPHHGHLAEADKDDYEMRFKLPTGVSGNKVLLQWKYVTANRSVSDELDIYTFTNPYRFKLLYLYIYSFAANDQCISIFDITFNQLQSARIPTICMAKCNMVGWSISPSLYFAISRAWNTTATRR